jgi:hypothetical protein
LFPRLTPFFTETERKQAGCQHRLFFSQIEFCDNLIGSYLKQDYEMCAERARGLLSGEVSRPDEHETFMASGLPASATDSTS